MFTPQETFDMSCLALVEQGEPGYDCGCRYLTEDGRRCAAGHLMTAPREVLVGLTGGCCHESVRPYLREHDDRIVGALQGVHDNDAWRLHPDLGDAQLTPEEWRATWMRWVLRVAEDWGLDPARVLEAARAKGWKIPEVLS